jgi:NTP pyrophosphatase (non-canonical NTP hydrolase)
MTFDEYQKSAVTTDVTGLGKRIKHAHDPAYVDKILSLVGEAGEVAEKYKKIIRDKGGVISQKDREEIAKELGDVLWYLAVIAYYLDFSFSEVAKNNLNKLASRTKRGALKGKGDNR